MRPRPSSNWAGRALGTAAALVLTLVAFLIGSAPVMAAPLDAQLTFSLSSQPSPNSVRLVFTLVNQADKPVRVLKWQTPLEGILGRIFQVRCDGRELIYNGPLIKRGPPTAEDYVTIPAKGSLETVVNLSEAYDFPASGSCEVRFNGVALEVLSADARLPQEMLRNVRMSGEPLSFFL